MKKHLLTAVILAAATGSGLAQTITEQYSIPTEGSEASLDFTLPEFDSSIGTLTGVSLTFDYTTGGTVNAYTIANSPAGTFSGEATLPFTLASPGASVSVTADTGYQTGDYSTTPGEASVAGQSTSGSLSTSVSSSDFSSYEGTGLVSLNLSSGDAYSFNLSSTSPSTVFENGTPTITGTATVVYTYNAPEPTSWALLLAGVASLGALQRFRNKTA